MAAKKKVDPIKQREKRAKIAAVVGVVLLLGVAAFEIPSMMKVLNKKPPPGANATDAGNRNPDGSIPLPNVAGTGGTTSTGVVASGELADTDVPPAADGAQLVSFNVFQTKNPFTPQVSDASTSSTDTTTPAGTTAPSSADKGGADVPAVTTPTVTTPATPATAPPAQGSAVPPASTTPAAPVTQTVAIAVNGKVSRVAAQGTFPTGAPVFRLVSWHADTAQIGIVGGSYATGDATLTLRIGHPVTLENTTDSKTYKLLLISTP